MKRKLSNFLSEILLAEGQFSEDQEFELLSDAKQTDPRYGEFSFSKSDMEEMCKHFNEDLVGCEIPVDINHEDTHEAVAWLKPQSMRVGASKKLSGHNSIYAQLYRYTPDGIKKLSTGAFRYFSLQIQEGFEKMVEGVKKSFGHVVRALALTNMPVIKGLAPTFSEMELGGQGSGNFGHSGRAGEVGGSGEGGSFTSAKNDSGQSFKIKDRIEIRNGGANVGKQGVVRDISVNNAAGVGVRFDDGEDSFVHVSFLKKLSTNLNHMTIKQFLLVSDNMLKQAKLSDSDIVTLKTLADELPAEEKPQAEAPVAAAEAKVAADKVAEEAKAVEDKELAEKGKTFTFAEVKAMLNPISKQLNDVITAQRGNKIMSDVNSLMLSESKKVGFKASAKDNVANFLKTLSDEQVAEYMKIHSDIVTSVDLSESGSAEAGKTLATSEASVKLKTLCDEKMKDGKMKLSQAMKAVLIENPELAKEASKTQKC